ncbi:hypothetical protein AALO_G00103990 [Alosa alosa]|uniref:Uncharacterized protein n=1 Tax=Alosa alosa TaxID=278164 RepID=A0AAV6GUW2_9TELE|nr:hypothetical protein AALO_G00103990 [Alosa alosa]
MKKARDKVESPSQHEQCSSGRSHSSSSGSAPGFLEETHLSSFQECILSFSEEEWEDFSSLLNTPMTRTQFSELCMAILKVVSLSSMIVIVPAYISVAKDAGTPVSRTSTSFPSPQLKGHWLGQWTPMGSSWIRAVQSEVALLHHLK